MVISDGRFVGVDWASEEHAVCVVDERGRIVEGRRFRHDESGIRALCARLVRRGPLTGPEMSRGPGGASAQTAVSDPRSGHVHGPSDVPLRGAEVGHTLNTVGAFREAGEQQPGAVGRGSALPLR